jgi:hypothetical protein
MRTSIKGGTYSRPGGMLTETLIHMETRIVQFDLQAELLFVKVWRADTQPLLKDLTHRVLIRSL